MSAKQKKIIWPVSLVGFVVLAALAFAVGHARTNSDQRSSSLSTRLSRNFQGQWPVLAPTAGAPRNMSLQPEASNLARRLGKRFAPDKRELSVLIGTLTRGTDLRLVHLIRRQRSDGEQVEINIDGSLGSLTWDGDQGALSSGARASGAERELIERLVLDSPDQFVLAQLRGASYYTVAQNVRPAGVSDDYAGPRWDIVRVDDPDHDAERRPQNAWRLYYLNTATGLIDKIVCQVQGEPIVAEISGWTEVNGEKVPGQITWTRQGRTLMQYRLTNFSLGQQ